MPSFMDSVTAAPPAPAEIAPEAVQASPDAPAVVIPPTPPAETKAEPAAPAAETKPETKPAAEDKAQSKKGKKEETKAETKSESASAETTPEASTEKPETPAAEVKTEATAEQVEEEKLTPEEEKIIGKMTPKEFRAVFAARNKAERLAKKQGVELEKALKEVKKIATLEATVKELEKRPTTEANDAKIAAFEAEALRRKADLEKLETEVKEREENVRLREYATEVRKTPDYAKFVTEPTTKMLSDLNEICRGASENDEEAAKLDAAVRQALGHDDRAIRARELKKVVAELSSFDQTALRGVLDQFNQILVNEATLAGTAEQAKKSVTEHRAKEETAKRTERVTRFQKADTFTRAELEKEIPFLTMDLKDFPHYQKIRDEWEGQRAQFLKDIEAGDVTPETVAALHEMAGSYQLAKIVSKDYQAQILDENKQLQEKLAAATKQLEEIKSKDQKVKDEEEEEEAEAEAVTPSIGNGRESGMPQTFTPGEGRGGGRFSSAVYAGKDK